MCKPDSPEQTRMFEPDITPAKEFREETLETLHQIAANQIEILKELRQLRGIAATHASHTSRPTHSDDAPVRPLDKYADRDRLVAFGKDGLLDRVYFILTPDTAKDLNVTSASRGRVTDDLRCIPNCETGTRSTWKIRPDGTAILQCRRAFPFHTSFEYSIHSVTIKDGIIFEGPDLLESVEA